ncbi:MFS transporter [Microvirga flavescens]|uniref:MFS transporter n=1 Tax=Microvirga flavescens TaxID=2249811 RepID=UPI0013007B68|nr:MFS transporter [Microvirga flavescens]
MNTNRPLPARAAASAIFFGNGFGIGNWAAQLPRFKDALDVSDGELSVALLAFALGAIALMPTVGWLLTRLTSRRITIATAFGFALTLFFTGLAPSLPVLFAASLLAGACNGAMDVAMNTHATVVEKAWNAPIMSSFHAFFSLGGLAGAMASGAMIGAGFAIGTTFLVSCAGMALVFFAASFFMMEDQEKAAGGHGFAWPRGALMGLAVLAMLCMVVEGAMVDWTAIYLRTVAGAELETAAMGFAAFSLTMTVCRFMGDFLVSRLGRTSTLRLGGVLAGTGLTLAIAMPTPVTALIGFALVGFGLSNAVPVLFSSAAQVDGVPPGMGVAMVATLGYGGLLMGPPIIGFGGDHLGLRMALIGLVACSFVIVLFSRRALRPTST